MFVELVLIRSAEIIVNVLEFSSSYTLGRLGVFDLKHLDAVLQPYQALCVCLKSLNGSNNHSVVCLVVWIW